MTTTIHALMTGTEITGENIESISASLNTLAPFSVKVVQQEPTHVELQLETEVLVKNDPDEEGDLLEGVYNIITKYFQENTPRVPSLDFAAIFNHE